MLTDLTSDFVHMTDSWGRTGPQVWRRALPRMLVQGRFRTVAYYRLSQAVYRGGMYGLALWLQSRGQRASGAEIHPASRIGQAFNLAHGGGVVVGHEVVAGTGLVLYQGTTLGHGRGGRGQPRIGDRVTVFAGAVLLGPICVGDDATIGASAVVLADVPPSSTIVGVWKG